MQTMTDIGTLIVKTLDTCGGRPRIAGSRITVQYIVTEIKAGITPEAILEDKSYLTLGGIYAALAYYYANQDSLDAAFAVYEAECRQLEAEYRAEKML